MQKIIPHLWFDREAVEAAQFYVAAFGGDSQVDSIGRLEDTPSGSTDFVSFTLLGREFQAISAGPDFKFNPSISFQVLCGAVEEVDALWGRLSDGGMALMELGAYPFSERYAWLQDRYGLSWQLFYSGDHRGKPQIRPALMFVGGAYGQAGEAMKFWTSLFPGSKIDSVDLYGPGQEPNREGSVRYAVFSLAGQKYVAMDSGYAHAFSFNEAVSFIVQCETQAEIDRYWQQLSAVPEAEQCGWLKDRFGVSWQVIPAGMDAMLLGDQRERIDRVTQAFLAMKKIDLAALQAAYEGKS